jgi:2-polyprenyl-3-methyl-5-hydroxy-6-metoxy-1,4-benzoquinol methylase
VLEIAGSASSRAADALRGRGVRVESRTLARIGETPADAYDAVLLDGVLEGLEDPAAALESLLTMLAPDGVVLASVPNVGHWSVVLGLIEREAAEEVPLLSSEPRRFFTRATLADLFEAAGLRIDAVEEIHRAAPPERAPAAARLRSFPGASPDLDVAVFLVAARRATS